MIVTISDNEFLRLDHLAHLRSDPKEHLDKNTKWSQGSRSSLERHRFGLMAEFATAKLLGLEIDTEINSGDRGRGDLRLLSGEMIEVKSRMRRNTDFALRTDNPKSFKADFGVLCWPSQGVTGKSEAIDVVGWCRRKFFLDNCFKVDYGYGPRLAIKSRQLSPMQELIEYARQCEVAGF